MLSKKCVVTVIFNFRKISAIPLGALKYSNFNH
jgi:hypothetical protein